MYEDQLLDALGAALATLPGARVWPADVELARTQDARVDAVVEAEIGGERLRLVIEAKRNIAFPRDARELVWQLRDYLKHFPADTRVVPIVAAQSLSPGARQLLRDEGVGYFDLGGSLYIPAPGAFVFVDRPPPKAGQRKINALFVGRRALVLQAVWEKARDWFSVGEIAERAAVSAATASETLIELERREWLDVRGAGPSKERALAAPSKFLDAWRDYKLSSKPTHLQYYYVRALQSYEISSRFDELAEQMSVLYALTGEAAAQIHAPFLTSVPQLRVRLEMGAKADRLLQQIEAKSVTEGWNLAILGVKHKAEFNFRQRLDGAWMASPLQAYLDLLNAGARGAEAADHLRRESLRA